MSPRSNPREDFFEFFFDGFSYQERVEMIKVIGQGVFGLFRDVRGFNDSLIGCFG